MNDVNFSHVGLQNSHIAYIENPFLSRSSKQKREETG